MLEILYLVLLLTVTLPLMAKKTPRRRQSRFAVIKVTAEVDLGALTAGNLIKSNLFALAQSAYAISADLTWSIDSATADQGPYEFGLTTSDLSVTEVLEALDASPSNEGDIVQLEHSRRPVRVTGIISTPLSMDNAVFNDGRKKRTRMGWAFANAKEPDFWCRNTGGTTLTTGTLLRVAGSVYIRWR